MRLAIGTAQFGFKYGIFNKKKIDIKEFKKIEKLILKSKVTFIDTAINYGESETVIGKSKLKKLSIITKIKIPNGNVCLNNWVNKTIKSSLARLKVNSIYGVLVHDFRDVLGVKGRLYLKILRELKKRGIIKKIGLSIYNPMELKKVWKFWKPDIVQAPFNIFDQRLLNQGWIKKLKKNKKEIFVRSCFLQGLLINDYTLINNFKNNKKLLDQFAEWCKLKNITRQGSERNYYNFLKYLF
jgi:aryl-alcohol dehydrogenase-like predicted oxidoreductase